jgi:hypothetical protein
MAYNAEYWEKMDRQMKERKAKQKAEADYVAAEMAKDPRVAHIYKHFRYMFLKDTEGQELEREKLLAWAERDAIRKANQPNRFWEIWKH